MPDKRKYAEYFVYVAAIVAILAIIALPTENITGEVVERSIGSETIAGESSVEIKNTDDFQWNNVRLVLEDEDGFEYNCPKMLYLKPGSTAVIDISYCFSKANVQMIKRPVKVTIIADEGVSYFVY